MKTIKSLVLGSAAGLLAIGGVQAADLPMKAKAVEYVRVCSLYGAGFFYIPGTDTCIKLGGFVRIDTTFNGGIFDQPLGTATAARATAMRNYFATRSRMALIDRHPHRHRIRRCSYLRPGQLQFRYPGQHHRQPDCAGRLANNTNLLSTTARRLSYR